MDDWEKAYEEDRRRMVEGKDVVLDVRHDDALEDMFKEKDHLPADNVDNGALWKSAMPQITPASFGTTNTAALPQAGWDAAPQAPASREDEEEIMKFYSQYGDESLLNKRRVDAYDYDDDDKDRTGESTPLHDSRFNLTCLPAGWNLHTLFGTKMGRRLFFAEVVTSLFKTLFSSKETLVGCFVTPNCIYIGDVHTGAILLCIDIQLLFEIRVFEGLGLGLRTATAFDLFLQAPQHVERLLDILQKIAAFWKAKLKVVRSTAEQAKAFKKEMHLIDKKRHSWRLVEDPRTGLRIVNVTGQFINILAPVSLKILHWFGFVSTPTKDWKGSKKKQRRCAWVSATCFFVAREEGPGGDGRNIKHCVAMQYMTELYVGPEGELGIVAAAGPPQPPVSVVFDTEEAKNAVIFIFQECYNYRNSGGSIKVTHVNSVEEKVRLMKTVEDAQPQLFLMRPQKELYEFLRDPSGRK